MATASSTADSVLAKMLMTKSILEDGYTMGDFLGIGPEEIEGGYAQAHRYINSGQADKAEELLAQLCHLDNYQSKLWMALGVARQVQRKYTKALEAYGLAGLHDTDNPHLPLHAAECFMALKRWQEAADAAEGCTMMCQGKAELESLQKRATTIMNSAKKKLSKNSPS